MSDAPSRKFHVTLIRAPLISREGSFNNEAVPHLGLAYVAGYLRHFGHEVEIIDGTAEGLNEVHPLPSHPGFQIQGITLEDLVSRIPAQTQVVGFTSMFSAEWILLRDLIRAVRARFPKILFVAGGEHFTAIPEYCLRDCRELDVIVKGEGEHTLCELLDAYGQGDYTEVGGICYLDSAGRFQDKGGLPRIKRLESIPWPYWPEGYLEKFWKAGKSYGVRTERDMPILGSRGCPYRCTFCSSPQMWTTRYVLRDIDDLIAEIKHYVEKYQITSIQLYDLTVFTKKAWTVAFCKRLLAEKINVRWSLPSGTRSEVLDDEVLPLLKATNCDYLAYAPESGSKRTLQLIKKRIKPEKMVRSIAIAKRLGLVVRTNLIIGFPHETRRDVLETLFFGVKMALMGVDEAPYFIFSAYPGTEIFAGLIRDGVVKLNDEYFMSLVSFNGKFSNLMPRGVTNRKITSFELATSRLAFMLLNYAISYFLFPKRIFRTLRNILGGGGSATVFENRLQDALRRKSHSEEAARSVVRVSSH
ncbi:MAG TPA: radical SAM protein [Planctomycetota bacterium]|nr:radical SAM protein [Planctomycetota bacterium]